MEPNIILCIIILTNIMCVSGHYLKSSLTFVIDDTSSMSKDIDQVKIKTNEVFDAVLMSNSSMIDEFVLVTFNDPDAEVRTITSDRNEFRRALASISVHGGGDCPEMAMKGVELALENSKPNSFFYIFTDASASDHKRYEYIKNIGQRKSIQVTFLLTGLCGSVKDSDYKVYHSLAEATSGQVFHMYKDDVGKILEYVIESIKSKKTPLGCKMLKSGYGKRLSFTVDSKISDVLISVSGYIPRISIKDPQGLKPNVKEIVNILFSNVVKIITTPGVYSIEVGSKSDTSVLITGSTAVCFQHGFTPNQPASIFETSTNPTPGEKNYLSIALFNDERDVELETVEIRDMDDNVLMNKTLQLLNKDQQFYVTEPFDLPKKMCKIAINGKINGKEPITRVGSTSFEYDPGLPALGPIKNKPPKVHILSNPVITLDINDKLTLMCKVSGYPKPDIIWMSSEGIELSSKVSQVHASYDYLSTLEVEKITKNMTYHCKANNIVDKDETSVQVVATEKVFFNVVDAPKDTSIAYKNNAEIKCIVDAFPPVSIQWYKDNNVVPINPNLDISSDNSVMNIKNMVPELIGKYSCGASNAYDTKTFDFLLTMLDFAPSVNILGERDKIVEFDSSLALKCEVTGYPKPTIIWEDEYGNELIGEVLPAVSKSDYISILNIAKVNKNTTYSCKATNIVGTDSKGVEVKAKENRFFKVIEFPKDENIVYQGSKNIKCEIDALPPATITWLRDNQIISTDNDFDISSDGSTLIIKKMEPELVGNYSCNANSIYDSKTFKFEVMILGVVPRVDIVEGSEISVEYNEPLSLNCKMSGYPKPNLIWQNSVGVEEPSVLSLLNSTHDNSISVFSIAKVNENATYYCIATNSYGTDKKSINVKTEQKTYFNVIEVPKDGTIAYKTNKEIRCIIDAQPAAQIFWYTKGKKIIRNNNFNISPDGTVLKLKSMRPEFVGKYYCEAINQYERKTFDFNIKISGAEKPKIHKQKSEYKVQRGSNVNLDCSVIQGKPKPSISWQFKRSLLGKYENLGSTEEHFKIFSAKTTDTGTYRCMAKNEIGDDYYKIDVLVEYPPVVEIDTNTLTVENKEQVKLACRVDGSPAPDVGWFKDGNEITNGNKYRIYRDNTLSFTGMIQDSGIYTCKASNILDEAEKSIHVDFYIPVKIEIPTISSIVLDVGGSSNISCKADGYPKPNLKWTYYSFNPNIQPEVFTPEDDPGTLIFENIQIGEEGFYTCTAENIGGSLNVTYSVDIAASPNIIKELGDQNLKPVIGDLLLRIPCNYKARPKPTILWFQNGLKIDSGINGYEIEESGTLVIKNIDEKSTASYTCEVKNNIGSDLLTFEVEALAHPIPVEPEITIFLTEGETREIECELPYNPGDFVRWFKDNKIHNTGELTLVNAMMTDRGIYSCRVSNNEESYSFHVKITVGIKPTFMTEENKYIEFNKGFDAILECSAVGDPIPKIIWTRNKRIIDVKSMTYVFSMKERDIGLYVCNVSNDVGFIIRSFEIKPGECSLNIETDFIGNQPLLLSASRKWPTFEKSNGHVIIPQFKPITLYCPGTFFSNPGLETVEYVSASCVQNSILNINGIEINFSDIKCQKEINTVLYPAGMPCGSGQTELIHVGYSLKTEFLGVFDICFDKKNRVPIFSRISIDRTVADIVMKNEPKYVTTRYMPYDFENFYQCSQQINAFPTVLRKPIYMKEGCCFTKRQLVNPRDLLPGMQQVTTYNYLNVMPQWSSCNTQNWDDIERRIRSIAMSLDYKMFVWSGQSSSVASVIDQKGEERLYLKDNKNQQQAIPKFLWKVIQNMEMHAALAIIQINLPHLTLGQAHSEMLCKDICDEIEWLKGGQWHDVNRGFIYCCDINSFEKAFNSSRLFKGTGKVLKQIPDIIKP